MNNPKLCLLGPSAPALSASNKDEEALSWYLDDTVAKAVQGVALPSPRPRRSLRSGRYPRT